MSQYALVWPRVILGRIMRCWRSRCDSLGAELADHRGTDGTRPPGGRPT